MSGIALDGSNNRVQLRQVITDEERKLFELVFLVFICGGIALCGIIANIINIIVFYKQGFQNTVNIAFLGLATSDLFCLIALEWVSISMYPFLATLGVPWAFHEVMYVTGGWPHVIFCRITSYITVYITAERYLCIAFPLKIKQMITTTKTILIITLIYLLNLITLIPYYSTSYLGWKLLPEKNMSLVGLFFTSNRKDVDDVCYVVHSVLSAAAFLGVIIFTVVLVTKLKQNAAWRKEATSANDKRGAMTTRDQKTVKMVVLIASILIICYTPGAVAAMATFFVGPVEFSILGEYLNMCVAVWSIACSFQTVNSSVNIFLYYTMSSKYRQTFDEVILNQKSAT